MRTRTVLATGVFDILHTGHLRFLEESKKLGGPRARLVVVVASDRTVLRRKGRRPVFPERQRVEMVAALRPVNRAILGRHDIDYLGILREVKPEILCVGYDQTEIKTTVSLIAKREKLPVRIVQLNKFDARGLDSSSGVKRRVVRNAEGAKASLDN